ncbi:rod shape-determining protein MreC [Chryseomicrobium excrementi]|uniref:Cell shape-determining protein MreC n=1 Tax=Chryseomicrobium excrementi TaxID=2041346 RepID=A0A2M9F1Z2_9BACL|nr:rod shape-determining protein MreC [Chryseomicrobium excrementi]PJK17480.1 rod shape-determining protein MreC [Chryseomicrobium excrementi]
MPSLFSAKRLILLLVGMIVLVVLISFTLRGRDNANPAESLIKDVVGFGQSLVAKPTHFVVERYKNVEDFLHTYEENERLKARIQDYAAVQAEVQQLQQENAELKELTEVQEDLSDYEPIRATVIARNPEQWDEKIILDRGKLHGVSANMAVMTAQGLIGKVTLVTNRTATVELVTTQNPNNRISAFVAEDETIFGLIEGYDEERRELILRRLDTNAKIEKGQKITTSGLGGIFPKGLYIGEVTEVTSDDHGLTKLAYVKPADDFLTLNQVMIAARTVPMVSGEDGTAEGEQAAEGEDSE